MSISALFSLCFLLPSSVLFFHSCTKSSTTNSVEASRDFHVFQHVIDAESVCEGTLYTDLCVSTVAATLPQLRQKTLSEVIAATVNATMKEVSAASTNCSGLRRRLNRKLEPLELHALDDCLELFSETAMELTKILADLNASASPDKYYDDIMTLLSGAMTNQYTCLDGLSYSSNNTRRLIEGRVRKISRHTSNALAMVKKLKKRTSKNENPVLDDAGTGFPVWLKKKDRRLLQLPANETRYDLVVAKDGSGNFTTINDAVNAAPNNSNTRFVIYIKSGAYYEYVEIPSKNTMIMLLGDGIGRTLIKGNRSVIDGWTTFRSATVAAVGNGFMAKGITIENYAGPAKHQAVAFRSGADFTAMYQCSFVGYQDTLYVHSLRQFYRECDIYGTIDFIFGNAAVVFQNSNLYARRPLDNQQNIFTAQGREDPNQNTGISILNCKVAAAVDLLPVLSQFQTYLGRPWKEYSRTVYLFSKMEQVVDPKGWMPWDGDFALSTLYYGEYMNRGPGSNTSARVNWPGYRVINNSVEANQFTVGNFIQGSQWLPATGFPFFLNLTAPVV